MSHALIKKNFCEIFGTIFDGSTGTCAEVFDGEGALKSFGEIFLVGHSECSPQRLSLHQTNLGGKLFTWFV